MIENAAASAPDTKRFGRGARYVFGYCALIVAAEVVNAFRPTVSGGLLCLLTFVLIVHAVAIAPSDLADRVSVADVSRDALLCATLVLLAIVTSASVWALLLPVNRISASLWPALVAVPTLVALGSVADVFGIDVLGRWRARVTLREVAVVVSAAPLALLWWAALPDRTLGLHHAGATDVVIAATTAFLLGFVEELLFRGALQRSASKVLGVSAAVIAVAVLSAFVAAGNRSVGGVALLFVVGLGYGYVAVRSDSVRAPALAKALILSSVVVISAVR